SSPRATTRRRARSGMQTTLLVEVRLPGMEVLSPRSLEEALAIKAEWPDAVPIQGGTDVMVELNFDRARPPVLLNLNEVPELRGWSRDNGMLRLGSGLTDSEARGLGDPPRALARGPRAGGGRGRGAGRGPAERDRRHDRRHPRHGLARRRRAAAAARLRRGRGGRVGARRAPRAARGVPRRSEAQRARARGAHPLRSRT